MISQCVGAAANILPELVPRSRPAGEAILSDGDKGRAGRIQGYTGRVEQVLSKVQPGAGKEIRTGKHGRIWRENLRTQGSAGWAADAWAAARNERSGMGVRP